MVTKKIEKQFPAAELVRKDPKIAAALAKTVANHRQTPSRDEKGNRKTLLPQTFNYRNKLERRAKRNNDARMILKLLPDLELSIQILTSSILSPADMTTYDLNYVSPANLFSSELSGTLITRIKDYFEQGYKIKALLPEMLRDILAEKGSYPVAVLPENVIDEIINGNMSTNVSMESMRNFVNEDGTPKSIGILGSPTTSIKNKIKGLSLEGFKPIQKHADINTKLHYAIESNNSENIKYIQDDSIQVTDNIMVLKFPKINARLKQQAIRDAVNKNARGFSLESATSNIADLKIENLIYKPRNFGYDPVVNMKSQSDMTRNSVGLPLIMKLPSESVLPVHVPGDPKHHIGYFVILDEEGNPIEAPDESYYYKTANKGLSNSATNSLSSNIISKINTNMGMGGNFDPNNVQHLDYAAQVYADMVERDLINRVKNGIHSSSVDIAKNEDIYRIMLSRTLSRKFTQILYIPTEYLTYMAFKFDEDGVGQSLLDESSVINTLRSVLLFSDVIASIKNSIGRTQVNMTLPEDDPNPMKTIEDAQEEIVRSRQLGIPLGVTNPGDITDFIQRAGYEWAFTGHPGLPDLKFEFNNTSSNYAKPDSDLQDLLKKHSIMAMGLSPETVDAGFNAEFATTIISNNVLLTKRIIQYQELFNPSLTDHLKKILTHSEEIYNDLKQLILDGYDGIKYEFDEETDNYLNSLTEEQQKEVRVNFVLKAFLDNFEVKLPAPPNVSIETQMSEYGQYVDGLERAIEAYISDQFMTENTAGELSNQIETVKAMAKAYFLRKWMSEKGIMTELTELVAVGENDQPQLNLMQETRKHIESIVRSCVTVLEDIKPTADNATDRLEAIGAEPEPEDMGNDSDSDTGAENATDDDLGFDDGMDEPPAEDETPSEDEEPDAKPDL